MLCKTVNAMSFAEYSYESEFESYESSFVSLYPSTGKNSPRTAAVRLLTAFAFRTLLVDSFRQAAFFVACNTERQQKKMNVPTIDIQQTESAISRHCEKRQASR